MAIKAIPDEGKVAGYIDEKNSGRHLENTPGNKGQISRQRRFAPNQVKYANRTRQAVDENVLGEWQYLWANQQVGRYQSIKYHTENK